MGVYYLTVAMAMIPLGLVIFIYGMDKTNRNWLYSGAIIVGIGIIVWICSLVIAQKEQKQDRDDRKQQHNELIEELQRIRGDLKPKSVNETNHPK